MKVRDRARERPTTERCICVLRPRDPYKKEKKKKKKKKVKKGERKTLRITFIAYLVKRDRLQRVDDTVRSEFTRDEACSHETPHRILRLSLRMLKLALDGV
jgi:hypothetical protein